jgi:hypothetical protein
MNAVQPVLPESGIFLEYCNCQLRLSISTSGLTSVVRRHLHCRQRIQVFPTFVEQVVPAPDETTFVLVVDKIEGVRGPSLFNLLDELLQSHLALGL